MGYNIKTTVEIGTKNVVKEIVKGTPGDAIMVGYDLQKEGIRTPIWTIVEGDLMGNVEQGRLDIILVRNVDERTKSTRFMDA